MNKSSILVGLALSAIAVPAAAQVTTPGVGFGVGTSGIVNSAGGSSAAIGGGTMGPNAGGAIPGGGTAGFGAGTMGPNAGFAIPGGASGAIGAGTSGPGALSAFPGASSVGINGSSTYSTGAGSPLAPASTTTPTGTFQFNQQASSTLFGTQNQGINQNALGLLYNTGAIGGGPNPYPTAQPGTPGGQWASNYTVGQPGAIPTGSGFVQIVPGAQNVSGSIQQPSFTNVLQPFAPTNAGIPSGFDTGAFTVPVASVNSLGTLSNPNGR